MDMHLDERWGLEIYVEFGRPDARLNGLATVPPDRSMTLRPLRPFRLSQDQHHAATQFLGRDRLTFHHGLAGFQVFGRRGCVPRLLRLFSLAFARAT